MTETPRERRLTALQITDALKRADGFRVGIGHQVHGFDGGCPVCQGSPSGIAEVLLAAGVAQPSEPTFTASEVKELTTKASEVALALGRKEALEQAAEMLDSASEASLKRAHDWKPTDSTNFKTQDGAIGLATGYQRAADRVRNMAPLPHQAASNGLTATTGHSDLPPTPEARKYRCHVCGFYRPKADGLEHHPKCRYATPDLPEGRDQ